MVTAKKTTMSASQTYDSLSIDTRNIARVAWEQAERDGQKLDEIKVLIEAGDFDHAIDEMSEFVGAKRPVRKEGYGNNESKRKAG
jgi:hypothetical protein